MPEPTRDELWEVIAGLVVQQQVLQQDVRALHTRVDALEVQAAARDLAVGMGHVDPEEERDDAVGEALDSLFDIDNRRN